MPHITITTYSGKTSETKRKLVNEVTSTVASVLNIKPETVSIIIHDVPPENWAIGGILDQDRICSQLEQLKSI